MPGFHLWSANRLERLAEMLAARIRDRSENPFAPETIVIQSRGMERWLALEIARRNGIAANLTFPFPDAFLQIVLETMLPEVPVEPALEREAMIFGIFALLAGTASRKPEFAPIRAYLQGDQDGVRRLQLARQIAYRFDQYLVYRPDMLLAWDEGHFPRDNPHAVWQAVLWRELTRGRTGSHRAALWGRMLETLGAAPSPPSGLPPRVSVFGVSYLPPLYLQAFAALAQVMAVDFYQLNPCREYWGHITSREESQRLQRPLRNTAAAPDENDLHLEEGNRLLASMGAQGRAFLRLVGDFDPVAHETYESSKSDSLLAGIQNDILKMHNRANPAAFRSDGTVGDRSVQVHACHSPMREIEVLYDQLLDLLNSDRDLAPRDILVLTPDIDLYAPYIQAVFGAPEAESMRLPYSIADRSPLQNRPVVEAFMTLMALKQSRFQASTILTLLDLPAIRSRFELDEEDRRLIAAWLSETRIRWSTDGEAKARLGLPPSRENTWQAGLERLLMGYALPAEDEAFSAGILPARGVEGTRVEALGHLVRFVELLQRWQRRLSRKWTPAAWADRLMALIDGFFRPELHEENDLVLIRRLIAGMRDHSRSAGLDEPVGIEVVQSYLGRRLEEEKSGGGFIAGGITFGALLPMRSIPAKLICLVGMNQDVFPREDRPPGFDLMADKPRLGDRSRRNDDKYLFLEALVSARRYFYISYVAYDIQDNTALPPSVLVSEFLDYAAEGYGLATPDLVVHQRRQAFSPDYFHPEHPRLFSYSRQFREAAASLASRHAEIRAKAPFIEDALPGWGEDFHTVDIETLARALGHPCRFLLEKRLQVQLQDVEAVVADRENFRVDPLERYQLGQALVDLLLAGCSASEALEKARAEGRLPHGPPGRVAFEDIQVEAEEIASAVQSLCSGQGAAPLAVNLRIPPYTLTGRLDAIFPVGQVLYRYARTRGPDLIGAWLRHLLWCRLTETPEPRPTWLITRDGQRRITSPPQIEPHLEQLLDLYERAGHAPLPLFPRSSWDYAVLRFEKGYNAARALERVRAAWERSFGWPGESADPYIQHCFRDRNPLDDAFAATAEALYGPILEHTARMPP